jgi:hypothetical protein
MASYLNLKYKGSKEVGSELKFEVPKVERIDIL